MEELYVVYEYACHGVFILLKQKWLEDKEEALRREGLKIGEDIEKLEEMYKELKYNPNKTIKDMKEFIQKCEGLYEGIGY